MTTLAQRRLRKSRTDRMIDGVCGGTAGYFGLDATLVRIAWVLLTLFGGSGIVLYIAAMIIMPKEETSTASGATQPPPASAASASGGNNSRFWGILLVILGLAWLASNFGFSIWHHWWGLSWDVVLPLVLILAGVAFLFGGRAYLTSPSTTAEPAAAGQDPAGAGQAGPSGAAAPARQPEQSKLYRSRTEKKLLGVCGGLADYMQLDPVIVRLAFVMAGLASFGIVLIAYIVLGIVVPQNPATAPAV
jgi:phage shock protein PspC (stress-responsive transcriptional regulator)